MDMGEGLMFASVRPTIKPRGVHIRNRRTSLRPWKEKSHPQDRSQSSRRVEKSSCLKSDPPTKSSEKPYFRWISIRRSLAITLTGSVSLSECPVSTSDKLILLFVYQGIDSHTSNPALVPTGVRFHRSVGRNVVFKPSRTLKMPSL